MKIKIINLVFALVVFLGLTATSAYAGVFSDNFNDGNADGWWLGYQQGAPWKPGNWRVEDGMLVQDSGGDNFIATYEGLQLSSQEVQADFSFKNDSGYGGLILWYKNDDNWVYVRLYPGIQGLWFSENINGEYTNTFYTYISPNTTWYTIKVIANESGILDVYVNGNYILSHQTQTTDRNGKSGVVNGNAGGYIDNFSLIWGPTNKNECKKNGWKIFTNPTFKNQGACISYLESNPRAGKSN